ncbi:MAG: hypothetical protein ACLVLI_00005, partial [Aedoeadaptatus pacaensis]
MKIRSTSLAMAAMMSAGFLAAPINVLAKAPEMPQGIYAQPFAEGEQAAAKEKHYDLKWKLKMADGSGKDSMAQDYIEKVTAVEKDGKWTFTISTKPESSQLIAKFYYYKDGTKFEAQQNGNDWSFTLDSKPENPIKLAFAITVMQGKEKEAFLEISDYKGIKGEASQEPETPGQNPKEDTPLEKAKKALEDAIEKANDADRDKLDVKVVNALNDSTESAGALLKEASAKEDDLALKVSELNFLLALGEETRGMDDTAKKAYKGFLTVASELKDAKLADKGSLKKNLDENAKLLKAADKKEEDLKKAGDAFALFMGNSKPADDTDIGHLKELVEKKKKVDSSSYTEETQKKLKDLLATAEKEIEAGKLTKGRVWELETAINSWHGELK